MTIGGDDSASFVSCLSFSPTNPALLGAGFSDGSTRLYDTRVANGRTTPVHTFWEHKRGERVLRVQLQDSGGYVGHMVSGSSDGHVSIVDLRKATIARDGFLNQSGIFYPLVAKSYLLISGHSTSTVHNK